MSKLYLHFYKSGEKNYLAREKNDSKFFILFLQNCICSLKREAKKHFEQVVGHPQLIVLHLSPMHNALILYSSAYLHNINKVLQFETPLMLITTKLNNERFFVITETTKPHFHNIVGGLWV